ncbi:MAG TPA: MFS transporter [Mycobacteriales bacterium]|nr:MFS transporter [Mycobacteriales bacterium]
MTASPLRTRAGLGGGVAAIVVAAVCMRTPLTAVGPVLERIGTDTGLSKTLLGLLSALPLLAFAAVSPLVHGPARRIGIERTAARALGLLAVGIALRSVPGLPPLWAGTALTGAGIAVCNVLVPVVVRRDHPDRVALMTGLYSAAMGSAAALASGVSLPLAHLPGSWHWSLGVWAVPAVVAAVVWSRRPNGLEPAPDPAEDEPDLGPVWRSARAWQLTAFMGLQSTNFYIMVAWLPSITASRGASGALGGWYLFAFQLVGIASGLVLPAVLHRVGTPLTGVVVSAPMLLACAGLIAAPVLLPLWVVLAGISSGAALVYALTRISLTARTSAEATKLSGMAQSIGYLLAAGGPVAAGFLRDHTGSWTPALLLVATVAVVQAVAAVVRL